VLYRALDNKVVSRITRGKNGCRLTFLRRTLQFARGQQHLGSGRSRHGRRLDNLRHIDCCRQGWMHSRFTAIRCLSSSLKPATGPSLERRLWRPAVRGDPVGARGPGVGSFDQSGLCAVSVPKLPQYTRSHRADLCSFARTRQRLILPCTGTALARVGKGTPPAESGCPGRRHDPVQRIRIAKSHRPTRTVASNECRKRLGPNPIGTALRQSLQALHFLKDCFRPPLDRPVAKIAARGAGPIATLASSERGASA